MTIFRKINALLHSKPQYPKLFVHSIRPEKAISEIKDLSTHVWVEDSSVQQIQLLDRLYTLPIRHIVVGQSLALYGNPGRNIEIMTFAHLKEEIACRISGNNPPSDSLYEMCHIHLDELPEEDLSKFMRSSVASMARGLGLILVYYTEKNDEKYQMAYANALTHMNVDHQGNIHISRQHYNMEDNNVSYMFIPEECAF